MRVAHFDCFSGASGDMILGSLIDAGVDADAIRAGLDSLGLPIKLIVERVKRGGIAATHARIEAPHEHVHRHLHHVEAIIDKGRLTEPQKTLAKGFFRRLAEAEAQVHGIAIEKVHFHEVGALDSIADFVGAAIGLDLLGAERITSRSVPPGSGTIQCDHGLMPVPAPATALLLRGVPLAASNITTELTTPTGAAILTSVVTEWTESPSLTVERIGYGAGTKDFPTQPNVLRLLVGTGGVANPAEADTVWVLETNLDDVTGEVIGYTTRTAVRRGCPRRVDDRHPDEEAKAGGRPERPRSRCQGRRIGKGDVSRDRNTRHPSLSLLADEETASRSNCANTVGPSAGQGGQAGVRRLCPRRPGKPGTAPRRLPSGSKTQFSHASEKRYCL